MESAEPKPIRYAGFWRRMTAYAIDQHAVALLAFLADTVLGSVASAQTSDANINQLIKMGWIPAPGADQSIQSILMQSGASGSPLISGYDAALFLACSFFYHVWMTASPWQATLGKRWCGIYVIRTNGVLISWKFSAIRWFARFMSWFTFCIGFMQVAYRREKESLHDAICATRVIYGKR